MIIDFNGIEAASFPGMNGGTGTMSARMYNDNKYRIVPTAIHPGGSIVEHIVHIDGVTGSSPVATTTIPGRKAWDTFYFGTGG